MIVMLSAVFCAFYCGICIAEYMYFKEKRHIWMAAMMLFFVIYDYLILVKQVLPE